MQALKGSPYNKDGYLELLTLLYAVLRMAKTQGALGLETHVEVPHESELFNSYPKFAGGHHAMAFLCDYLSMMTMGTENAYQMEDLIDAEIEPLHAKHTQYSDATNGIGDGLPAFGIVTAVLGVINTMGSILEPPEVLGGMTGGALVAHMQGHAPMIAVEFARKSLYSEFRPSFAEVEEAMNDVPAAA